MKSILLSSLILIAAPAAFAHEGHSHEKILEAPHGGIIKEGKLINLELVSQGGEVSLYPIGKDGKALPVTDVSLTASTQAPKKAKTKLDLKPAGDRFQGKVNETGYRFELHIEATHKGKKDSFKFQVEPQG